jgi:hypothetical protein
MQEKWGRSDRGHVGKYYIVCAIKEVAAGRAFTSLPRTTYYVLKQEKGGTGNGDDLVDDSQPMRELLRITPAGGAKVVGECEDGSEALEAYTRLRPDWVLMDVDMKGLDGITATRQTIALYPQAQVMIVTNHDDPELRRAAQ